MRNSLQRADATYSLTQSLLWPCERDHALFWGEQDSPLAAATVSSRDVAAAAAAAVGRLAGQSGKRPAVGRRAGSCTTWSADPGGASRRRRPRSPGRYPNLLQLSNTERTLTNCALGEWTGFFFFRKINWQIGKNNFYWRSVAGRKNKQPLGGYKQIAIVHNSNSRKTTSQ